MILKCTSYYQKRKYTSRKRINNTWNSSPTLEAYSTLEDVGCDGLWTVEMLPNNEVHLSPAFGPPGHYLSDEDNSLLIRDPQLKEHKKIPVGVYQLSCLNQTDVGEIADDVVFKILNADNKPLHNDQSQTMKFEDGSNTKMRKPMQ